jgi:hypothetical protein
MLHNLMLSEEYDHVMKKRERSTAYPALPLDAVIDLAKTVREKLGSGEITREQIAQAIGHQSVTGPAAQKVAAIAHYGLLSKGRGTYRISELATRVLYPVGEEERAEAVREAALTPSVFGRIYTRYEPEGTLPSALDVIMHREYGLTLAASKIAHENLVRTWVYAGLLDETDRSFIAPAGSAAVASDPDDGSTPRTQASDQRHESPRISRQQAYELPMSGGKATVTLPPELTKRDYAALESLVGLIKHFVCDGMTDNGDTPAEDK